MILDQKKIKQIEPIFSSNQSKETATEQLRSLKN